jgi:hypothetical protein
VSTGFFVNYTTTAASAAAADSDDDDGGFLAAAGGKVVVILAPVVAIVVAVVAVRRRYALQDALDGEAPFPLTEDDDGGLTAPALSARKHSLSSKRRLHRTDRAAAQRLASDPAEVPIDQQLPLAGGVEEMHHVPVLDSGVELPLTEAHDSLLNDAHGAAGVPKPAEPFEFL